MAVSHLGTGASQSQAASFTPKSFSIMAATVDRNDYQFARACRSRNTSAYRPGKTSVLYRVGVFAATRRGTWPRDQLDVLPPRRGRFAWVHAGSGKYPGSPPQIRELS